MPDRIQVIEVWQDDKRTGQRKLTHIEVTNMDHELIRHFTSRVALKSFCDAKHYKLIETGPDFDLYERS